ncbi:hypothetical protein M427DRAFT_53842 [Gonapodya prolifera JEL478]|uniref:J domain-containing protein n=1 Tax=Gonapodya prolifera (strain JEL478) TaxID=1344416 RepID=A0A139AP02_GONPJ|nr:hypothetical protein M427DRAFT_53842 [Gonapodya prolifera JEL478]|eukprot:KXS18462.1 hypothetical protein M427DRAFT_53842 [Gonapodya prolifera JEL478]
MERSQRNPQAFDPYVFSISDDQQASASSPPLFPPPDPGDPEENESTLEDRLDEEIAGANTSSPNYYAILNLDKNASDQDVRDAYKRLSMIFHPDKHRDTAAKEAAQRKFQTIQRAYDVLSEGAKRTAYDMYGELGISNGLGGRGNQASPRDREVGQRFKTPEEIRDEYERAMREKAETDVAQLVKSKGDISVTLDATALFDPENRSARMLQILANKRETAGYGQPQEQQYQPPPYPPPPPMSEKDHELEADGWSLLTALPSLVLMQQSFVRHSWDTKLSPSTVFTLAGNAMTRRGMGTGSVAGTVKQSLPRGAGMVDATLALGANTVAMMKWARNWNGGVFTTVQATSTTISRPPSIVFVAGRQISPFVTGFITYRTGDYVVGSWGTNTSIRELSGISLGTVGRVGKGSLETDVSAGLQESHLSTAYSHSIHLPLLSASARIRVRGSVTLSTANGFVFSLSTTRKVSKHSRIGIGLDMSGSGLTLRLRWSRLGQRLTVPILVSNDWEIDLAVICIAVPLGLMWSAEKFWVEPRRKRRIEEKLSTLRENHSAQFDDRKTSGIEAQRLMRDVVARKVEQERDRRGLLVVKALYGRLSKDEDLSMWNRVIGAVAGGNRNLKGWMTGRNPGKKPIGAFLSVGTGTGFGGSMENSPDSDEEDQEVLDVTVAVMSLVSNGQLHIRGGHPKSAILGFFDPCPGHTKHLLIHYQFDGRLHRVLVDDSASVAAPLRSHILSPREESELDYIQDAWPATSTFVQ